MGASKAFLVLFIFGSGVPDGFTKMTFFDVVCPQNLGSSVSQLLFLLLSYKAVFSMDIRI